MYRRVHRDLPGCEVLVTDIVDTTVPVLSADGRGLGSRTAHARRRGPARGRPAALPTAALDRLAAGDAGVVPALLGLGPGLTPLGDDVLCGWLATAVARRHPLLPDDSAAPWRSPPPSGPPTLSATLLALRRPRRGRAGVPEPCSAAWPARNGLAVEQSVDLILGVGETSGAGLLLGRRCSRSATDP